MNKLYFITHENGDGVDMTLLVYAIDPVHAFELWGGYYFDRDWTLNHADRMDLHCLSDDLRFVAAPNEGANAELRIFEVSTRSDTPRALAWHTDDLKPVAYMRAI